MCGIAGYLGFEPGTETPELVRAMCRTLIRRGPNDEGYYYGDSIALGMRRLSIIDVAGGHQPISNEDDTHWIVFNGEIFNYESLRRDLLRRGHSFKTHTDTETILHLFEEEGPRCLRHLRGMFALAIWNTRTRTLFLARDRLGIKPLHYYSSRGRFAFASEIKALLVDSMVPRTLDWTALDAFFAYGYIPAPWTAYRQIRKLPAGHYLLVDEGGTRMEQYWDLAMEPKWSASADDLAAEFVDRFRESVRMRLMSEVPLGAYLSGGTDSSLLVAIMAQESQSAVNTFTIGYGGATGNFLDERPIARDVAARFETEHREFEVLSRADDALRVTLEAFDEPFADDSVIPTHHICALARQHVTVALTGLGGDENFAGYERYLGFRLSLLLDRFPWNSLVPLARPAVHFLREEKGGHYRVNHLKRFVDGFGLPPQQRWRRFVQVFSEQERRELYSPDVCREIDFEAVEAAGYRYYDCVDAQDPIDRALYHDVKMYLPDDILALTDRVGMWHSLELRVPFLDHTLVEFCARIPTHLKLRGRTKKYLLDRVARPMLPPSVFNHRKQGFAAPLAIWLRGDLKETVESGLTPSRLSGLGVLRSDPVRSLLTSHHERRALNDRQILALLMFQLWMESRAGAPTLGPVLGRTT